MRNSARFLTRQFWVVLQEPNLKLISRCLEVLHFWFDRRASRAFAEHNESQGAQTTHDTGCRIRFVELQQPRLKKIEPWAGTHKGPQSLPEVFAGIRSFWKTLDFKVTDTIEQGNRVAFFGSFTYKSTQPERKSHLLLACCRASQGTRLLTASVSRTARYRRLIQNRDGKICRYL